MYFLTLPLIFAGTEAAYICCSLVWACFMERMPNLLDFTVSFTYSPFWSSLPFMHTNPPNLVLLFACNYIPRTNSSLNPAANPFHLLPFPSVLAHVNSTQQWSIRSIIPPWEWQCEGWLKKNNWPWRFFSFILLLLPQYLKFLCWGVRMYFFAHSFSMYLCTTVVITIYSLKWQKETCCICQKMSCVPHSHVHSHGTRWRVVMAFSLIEITALPAFSCCQEPMDLTILKDFDKLWTGLK